MKKFLLLTAIVAYATLPATSSAVDAAAEEYAVYSAVISKMSELQVKASIS